MSFWKKNFELKNTYNDTTEHIITDPEKIKFIIDNVTDYNYDDNNSKGYNVSFETANGEMNHNVVYISEDYLKKHNIL